LPSTLRKKGFEVQVLNSLERSTEFAVKRLREAGVPATKIEIRNINQVKNVLHDADAVVHAAAYIDVAESMEKPLLDNSNSIILGYFGHSFHRKGFSRLRRLALLKTFSSSTIMALVVLAVEQL